MQTLYKSFKAEADESGRISGYFSTYDRVPDSYGDIVAPGAFTESIKAREESGHPFPLVWNHNMDDPDLLIGVVDNIEDTEKGPLMTASFFDTQKAQQARDLVKSGAVYQFSFAYSIEDAGVVELSDGTAANELRKLNLFEVSIVPVPANQFAVVTDIKSVEKAVETIEEYKSGRRNSKSDAEKLEQAIVLIRDVLGQLDDIADEPQDGEDEPEVNAAAEEQKASNPAAVKLLEVIAQIKSQEADE